MLLAAGAAQIDCGLPGICGPRVPSHFTIPFCAFHNPVRDVLNLVPGRLFLAARQAGGVLRTSTTPLQRLLSKVLCRLFQSDRKPRVSPAAYLKERERPAKFLACSQILGNWPASPAWLRHCCGARSCDLPQKCPAGIRAGCVLPGRE